MTEVVTAGREPIIAIVVAQAKNRVIGAGNRLPWYLPEDLRHFRRITTGKPVIMGRKTYESIGRPLPERTNIVLTRRADWRAEPGVKMADSCEVALQLARLCDPREIMIIGGSGVYEQFLPLSERIYLTQLHKDFEGDALFPVLDSQQWMEVNRFDRRDEGNVTDYSFVTLERRASAE